MTGPYFWRAHKILMDRGTDRARLDFVRACVGSIGGYITQDEFNERFQQLVDQARATR